MAIHTECHEWRITASQTLEIKRGAGVTAIDALLLIVPAAESPLVMCSVRAALKCY